ncbi:MAG: hypothetical protein ACE5G2_06715 [Candidatus Krumholzibacteriia bacterium]
MATYSARVARDLDGSWVASALELPNCWSRGQTREEAVAKLRDEIRYRIEYCPCSGVPEDFVRVDLNVRAATTGEASRPSPQTRAPRQGSHSGGPGRWPGARHPTPAPLSGAAGCPSEPSRRPAAGGPEDAARSDTAPATQPALSEGWRRWDD